MAPDGSGLLSRRTVPWTRATEEFFEPQPAQANTMNKKNTETVNKLLIGLATADQFFMMPKNDMSLRGR